MTPNKVRITVTDGMGRKQVHEDAIDPRERTPSVAAKDLIDAAVILRDGDVIEVSFLYPVDDSDAEQLEREEADQAVIDAGNREAESARESALY